MKKKHFKLELIFLAVILIGARFYFTYSNRSKENQEPNYVSLNPENDSKIYWTDKALENKIREIINKKEGDIYLSDLWSYYTLELGRKIENTEIRGEVIEDISSLAELANLRGLNLEYHAVTDISVLHKLDNLQRLSLDGNPIQDFSAIESLPLLKELNLRNTPIKDADLEYLAGLKNLVILYLDFNEIESLEGLGSIRPAVLSARQNKIGDITSLTNLDGSLLWLLDLRKNQISKIDSLSKFKKLQYLSLSDNKITSIEPIKKLNKIKVLSLANNQIAVLPNLSRMTSLKTLDLKNNQISTEEWKKVKLPWSIRTVYLSGNPISDLETEREYPNLEVIFN